MSNTLETDITLLKDAVPTTQFNQLEQLAVALYQAAQNVSALAGTCQTTKQTAALRKVLAALQGMETACGEFVDAVAEDAFTKDGGQRWSVA